MNERTDGYVAGIGYTHDYNAELNPLHLRLALLNAGLSAPEISTACELGFGHGVSLAVHAVASTTQWFGTDFNAEHVDFARGLAKVGGVEPQLSTDSFAEFADRSDLPDFDYIGMHGVWSWISERNRGAIVDFVRRRLKPGGVFFVSYNALPGQSDFIPMQHLLREHAEVAGRTRHGIVGRIDDALAFADRLFAAKPGFILENAGVAERVAKLKAADRRYVAHEYFNKEWQPFHFADMAAAMAPAGLSYACSARYFDDIDALNLTPGQQSVVAEIEDPGFRQTVRDFMINRQFRRDYWVRGAIRLTGPQRDRTLRDQRVALLAYQPDLPLQSRAVLALNKTGPGEATLASVVETLGDHPCTSLGDIESALRPRGATLDGILEAVMLIASFQGIAAAQNSAAAAQVRQRTDRLNTHLIGKAAESNEIRTLASPVTGGGIDVNRVRQLFLLAMRNGDTRPDQWAQAAWKVVGPQARASSAGYKIAGKAYTSLEELTQRARTFADVELPVLKALQVV